jgi:hypothetical protein
VSWPFQEIGSAVNTSIRCLNRMCTADPNPTFQLALAAVGSPGRLCEVEVLDVEDAEEEMSI